jgi:hypothetical protein
MRVVLVVLLFFSSLRVAYAEEYLVDGMRIGTTERADMHWTVLHPRADSGVGEVRWVAAGENTATHEATTVELYYQSGKREVLFRTEGAYEKYILAEVGGTVCAQGDWSRRIVFRVPNGVWTCPRLSPITALMHTYMLWPEIDRALQEARQHKWREFIERIRAHLP